MLIYIIYYIIINEIIKQWYKNSLNVYMFYEVSLQIDLLYLLYYLSVYKK